MTDQMLGPENAGPVEPASAQERDWHETSEHDALPIGAVLRKLRGERTLRKVQKDTGIANSYLCNIELGYQQPGFRFLNRIASYYQVAIGDIVREAELLRNSVMDTEESRTADVERSYRFVMDDPRLSTCESPEPELSTHAKAHMVRIYELLTGRRILS